VEGTAGLVAANDRVVGDDGALEAEEGAIPVDDEVVAAAGTDDVTAAAEPPKLVGVVRNSVQIAVGIAVGAGDVEEVCVGRSVKC
jgi:hypothetical protein